MLHTRDMNAAEYAAAKADAIRAASARPNDAAATLARLRAKHPDLSAKADAGTWTAYRAMLRAVITANLDMQAAATAKAAAEGDSSALFRERAATRFAEAVAHHDGLQRQIEAALAALPPEPENAK